MENTSAVIGISDAMLVARTEARRIMDANEGDLVAEYKEIQTRLIASGLAAGGVLGGEIGGLIGGIFDDKNNKAK